MGTWEHRPRMATFAAIALAAIAWDTTGATAQPAADYKKASPAAAAQATGNEREVIIATVHLDGNANTRGDAKHPAEPFPTTALPPGGGLSLTAPDADGAWRIRAFVFEPRQVVFVQGDPVTLTFVGVQGPSHRIQVDGVGEVIALNRGEVKSVTIPGDRPGVYGFRSLDRMPSMQGSVVILPRS